MKEKKLLVIIVLAFVMFNCSTLTIGNALQYSEPGNDLRNGEWKKIYNRSKKLIAQGINFPVKYKNKIFKTSGTYFSTFGAKPTSTEYNPHKYSCTESTFDLNKIKRGKEFGIKAHKLKIWNQKKRNYDYIDLKFTVVNWEKYKKYKRKFGPFLAIKHREVPVIIASGLGKVTIRQDTYYTGSNKKCIIASNATYMDVDDGQGITMYNYSMSKCMPYTFLKTKKTKNYISFYNPRLKNYKYTDTRCACAMAYKSSRIYVSFFDTHTIGGKITDKKKWSNIWPDNNNYSYFSAGGVLTILPKNKSPEIALYEKNSYIKADSNIRFKGKAFKVLADFLDRDRDSIKTWYKIYRNGKLLKNGEVKKGSHHYQRQIDISGYPGKYKIVWYAKDFEMPDSKEIVKSYQFKIFTPIKIWSDYIHTEQWEKKRNIFNYLNFEKYYPFNTLFKQYISFNNGKDHNSLRPRYNNVFWGDEILTLKASVFGGKAENLVVELLDDEEKTIRTNSIEERENIWTATTKPGATLLKKSKENPIALYPRYKANIKLYDIDKSGNTVKKEIKFEHTEKDFPFILDNMNWG